MKKNLVVLMMSFLFINCQSNDDGSSVDATIISTIMIDGLPFIPDFLKLVPSNSGTNGNLIFNIMDVANGKSILVSIQYPQNAPNAPNGVYNFGIGETGTMLFAGGSYQTNNVTYSLAGYTVVVTKLNDTNKFKLEFQNVEAVEINTGAVIIISGSCEGNFNEI